MERKPLEHLMNRPIEYCRHYDRPETYMRVLYLDLDTTRADHLGCYGYHRETSPNIDRIAAEGIRYDNYFCPDAPCLPSRTALVTGMFGIHTGVVGHGGTAADIRIEGPERSFRDRLWNESLAGVCRSAGLKTALISPFAERHSTWSFYAGFTEMYNTGLGGLESAEGVTPTALDWIERNGAGDDWFLHINYWDPHTPYRAPSGFGNPFAGDPLPQWVTPELLERHWKLAGPHTAQDFGMYNNNENPDYPRQPGEIRGMDGFRRMIDGYDCGIRYNLDLVPTMAEILGVDPSDRWDGESFAASLDGRESGGGAGSGDRKAVGQDGGAGVGAGAGREYLVISQCAHVAQRGVVFDDHLYIRTYHDGFHPYFEEEMLFDLSTDPHETTNITGSEPEKCMRAVRYLNEWHDTMMATMPFPDKVDPMWRVINEKGPFHAWADHIGRSDYLNRLRKTGREYAIDTMIRRHPELRRFL